MEAEKIKDKIKKLLALSGDNANQSESESALLKAQELLLKYKIEMNELSDKTEVKIVKKASAHTVNTVWEKELAGIIAENFRCMMFYKNDIHRASSKLCVFFGEEDDAEVAFELFEFAVVWLAKTSAKYATMMRNKHNITKGVKQDYIVGFLAGLRDKFKAQVASKYALVVVVPQSVKEEYSKISLKKANFSHTIRVHGSKQARDDGYQSGRTFQTNLIRKPDQD